MREDPGGRVLNFERHRCVAARLERVLADLGVPLEATAEEQAASALGTSPIVRGP